MADSAAEIERSVAAAARTILEDRTGIATEIEHPDWNAIQIRSILDAAGSWSNRLRSEAETAEALALLVDRVDLRQDGIRLSIKLPVGSHERVVDHGPTHLTLTRLFQMQMCRRGIEMKFVIDGGPQLSRRSDPALLKLVARARCWFDDLVSGRSASMVDIGKRESVGKRYVSRIIRFAFLAPSIVEQIVNGCQPPDFTAESLLKSRTELPLPWDAQHKLVGFPLPA